MSRCIIVHGSRSRAGNSLGTRDTVRHEIRKKWLNEMETLGIMKGMAKGIERTRGVWSRGSLVAIHTSAGVGSSVEFSV